jgi:hypothetical protein
MKFIVHPPPEIDLVYALFFRIASGCAVAMTTSADVIGRVNIASNKQEGITAFQSLDCSACAGLQPVPQRPFTAVPRTSAGTHGLQIRASGFCTS